VRCGRYPLSVGAAPALAILLSIGASGCEGDRQPRGVPSASAWKPPEAQPSEVDPRIAAGPSDAGGGDPHAGMQMEGGGADPHAGLDMGGQGGADPHAGLDMGGQGGADPHAGLDMEGEEDPEMAALQPPDPDRKIDDKKFLRGTIRADAKLAGSIKSGAVMFLSAVPIEPTTGEVLGAPVAVARLDVGKLPVPFELTERNAMAAGTRFEGDVMITAWVDGDGEARTKEPGDVEGRVRARIPARNIDLVLDTALR
jgi:hypothetical protein